MPRKVKFDRKDIIDAAFSVIRKGGLAALSTRSVARKLRSSTMPIYSFMKSKKNLTDPLMKKSLEILREYQLKEYIGDIFLDMGIGFVIFAKHEKHLFRFIYDEQNAEAHKKHVEVVIRLCKKELKDYPLLKDLDEAQMEKFLLQGFTYSFGLAHLVNTGWYADLDEKALFELVAYTGRRYLEGQKVLCHDHP